MIERNIYIYTHYDGATGVQPSLQSKYMFSLQWNSFVSFYVLFRLFDVDENFYAGYYGYGKYGFFDARRTDEIGFELSARKRVK